MDMNRKKQLMEDYKNRHPEMGIIAFKCGESNFEFSVVKVLKYEDPQKDYTDKLEAMLEECLDSIENSSIIWK